MSNLSRRTLLKSAMTLSASTIAARHGWCASRYPSEFQQDGQMVSALDIAPREQLLFDFDWKFRLGHAGDPALDLGFGNGHGVLGDLAKTGYFAFAKAGYDDSKWRTLNLPHDWAIELPYVNDERLKSSGYKPVGRNYPATSVGWYRREFDIALQERGRRISIEFEGASHSALVFVNGCYVGRHDEGYTSFCIDVTDFIHYGGKNCVAVRVAVELTEGWFYEGAGLYRHVWLTKNDAVHLGRHDSTVRTTFDNDSVASLDLKTKVENASSRDEKVAVSWQIFDANMNEVVRAQATPLITPANGASVFQTATRIEHPNLWSIDTPYLYTALVTTHTGKIARDAESIRFGIRTAVFTSDRGFLLNGRPLKIQGTCNHQDHAGVGVALPDALHRYRLNALRQMGCNAVRAAHNMPAPAWVEACDRLGVLLMCETRQMSSTPEALVQLEEMIMRYRNSPSVVLWSIGNEEEQLQNAMAEQGVAIASTMVSHAHALDPTRPVSAAVNSNNEKGVSDALDIVGFNYQLPRPDEFHTKFPHRALYGSETGGVICTRGEYTTNAFKHTASAFDTKPDDWDETAEEWWKFYATRAWQAGAFVWTGFDYRGEPAPYAWPTVNAQEGAMDLCGFPKDVYYYYKAWWQKEPVLHLLPHWNSTSPEGELISARVYSNLETVELFINGKSHGSMAVPPLGHVDFKVPYQAGSVEAVGYKNGRRVLTAKHETTGAPTALRVTADRSAMDADNEDLVLITVEALDTAQRLVPTASNPVRIKIDGPARLIGAGNGDPSCQESDKEPRRSLFNGLAQFIVQSSAAPGEVRIQVESDGSSNPHLIPASLTIAARVVTPRPAVR